MILRWSKMYQGASTQFHTIANLHKALRTILTGCRCQSIAFWILSRSFPCRAAEGSRSRCGLNKWETSWRVWRMPWYALCMPDISGSMPFLLLSYRRDSGCLTVSWCRTYETSKSIRGLEVTWKRCHSAVAALPNSLGTTWKLRITHIEYLRIMQPNMKW